MTIRTRVAKLDDMSGELNLTLAKLELEATHGTANKDEQIDFVRDLSHAATLKEISPWKSRGIQAGLLGLASLAGLGAIHAGLQLPFAFGMPILLTLTIVFFCLAGLCLTVFFRRRQRERHWLQRQEASIQSGRSILEEG